MTSLVKIRCVLAGCVKLKVKLLKEQSVRCQEEKYVYIYGIDIFRG